MVRVQHISPPPGTVAGHWQSPVGAISTGAPLFVTVIVGLVGALLQLPVFLKQSLKVASLPGQTDAWSALSEHTRFGLPKPTLAWQLEPVPPSPATVTLTEQVAPWVQFAVSPH